MLIGIAPLLNADAVNVLASMGMEILANANFPVFSVGSTGVY